MLQKEKLEHVIPGPAPKVMHANNEREKMTGSLSDGSVCELPPLSKMAFRRHQLQNQTHYHKQEHMLPGYRTNGLQSRNYLQRKRFSSTGDRDQTGSSGYETASKKSKHESSISPVKVFDPVMENRVSSTNNDVVYKFTGLTPTEDFQVTYTLEERVRAAALALVYSNCKITTEKFEWLYDKPAPDFKTIFAWRQRLLTTGCLVDNHIDKKDIIKPQPTHLLPVTNENLKKIDNEQKQPVTRIPNPDEIPIISDSEDDEHSKDTQLQSKFTSGQRSVSAETLVIGANEHDTRRAGSSISTGEGRSQARSQSESSNDRSRSSSRDSQDSNYPDSDSDKHGKSNNSKTSATNKTSLPSRVSVHDSESDSISYNSEDENFLSRVYGEGRKVRRKLKKRTVPPPVSKPANYVANESHTFTGYSTAKPSIEQSPLVTGNIYTSNLRNMTARHNDNVVDTDGCSSEYIPTKLGSTTKNYQEFKNNVRRKGYWAKGNGTTFGKSVTISNDPITRTVNKPGKNTLYSTLRPQNTNTIQQFYNQNTQKNKNCFNNETVQNTASHNIIHNVPNAASVPNVHNTNIKNVHNAGVQNIHNAHNVSLQNVHYAGSLQNIYNVNETKNKCTNKPPQEIIDPKRQNLLVFNQPITNKPSNEAYPSQNDSFKSAHQTVTMSRCNNFSPENMVVDEYLPFDKPAQSTPIGLDNTLENTSRIFDVVQSNNTSKNRSILDIFMNDDQVHESPERINGLEKYEGVHKLFETTWDEDDDALYKNDSMDEAADKTNQTPLEMRAQSPISNMLYATDDDQSVQVTPKKISPEIIQGKQEMLLGLLKGIGAATENESVEIPATDLNQHSSLAMTLPDAIPAELSKEIICMSEEPTTGSQEISSEVIKPSKQINILESITIKPSDGSNWPMRKAASDISKETTNPEINTNQNKINDVSQDIQTSEIELPAQPPLPAPVLDLSNFLADININTNTLLLALQNLQQINQSATNEQPIQNEQEPEKSIENEVQHVETINLTNDEEWEKESNRDGSIERELEKLDGNTGNTPFLSDIFDPGPVVMPSSIGRKLNINLKSADDNKEAHKPHLNENAPVIGNFKSFALPKPIILNRLKLTVKPSERPRKANGKKIKRKKKVCISFSCTQCHFAHRSASIFKDLYLKFFVALILKKYLLTAFGNIKFVFKLEDYVVIILFQSKASASQGEEGEEDEEEESGDEADLSKYDLWGSDEEQGNSSKTGMYFQKKVVDLSILVDVDAESSLSMFII